MDVAKVSSDIPDFNRQQQMPAYSSDRDWVSDLNDLFPLNQPLIPYNLAQAFGMPFCDPYLTSHTFPYLNNPLSAFYGATPEQQMQYQALNSQAQGANNLNVSMPQQAPTFPDMMQMPPQSFITNNQAQHHSIQQLPAQSQQQMQQPAQSHHTQQSQHHQTAPSSQQHASKEPPISQPPPPVAAAAAAAALLQNLPQYQSMMPAISNMSSMPNFQNMNPMPNAPGMNAPSSAPPQQPMMPPNMPSGMSQLPNPHNMSGVPQLQNAQGMRPMPQPMSHMPNESQMQSMQSMQSMQNMPAMPNMPNMSHMPFPQSYPYPQAAQTNPYYPRDPNAMAMSGFRPGYPFAGPMMYPNPMEYPQMGPMGQGVPPPAEPSSTSRGDDDEYGEEARAVKRTRLVWTKHLHKRFEDAVHQLGVDRAVPKTIMQIMNVEGLTRENVASHLQKYRLQLKKVPRGEGGDTKSETDRAGDNSCSMGQQEWGSQQQQQVDAGQVQSEPQQPPPQQQ